MKKYIIIKRNAADLNNDDMYDVKVLIVLPQDEEVNQETEADDIFEELWRKKNLN